MKGGPTLLNIVDDFFEIDTGKYVRACRQDIGITELFFCFAFQAHNNRRVVVVPQFNTCLGLGEIAVRGFDSAHMHEVQTDIFVVFRDFCF